MVVTDKFPVELQYVPSLDQVWVLNWRSERDIGIKTVQVIRDAAQKRKHHTVHPEPIDGQFDLVRGLYIPERQVCNFLPTFEFPNKTDFETSYTFHILSCRSHSKDFLILKVLVSRNFSKLQTFLSCMSLAFLKRPIYIFLKVSKIK